MCDENKRRRYLEFKNARKDQCYADQTKYIYNVKDIFKNSWLKPRANEFHISSCGLYFKFRWHCSRCRKNIAFGKRGPKEYSFNAIQSWRLPLIHICKGGFTLPKLQSQLIDEGYLPKNSSFEVCRTYIRIILL